MSEKSRTILGFDYGTHKVGIAVGQEITSTVTPLLTLSHIKQKPDWDAISRLIKEWQPDLCVVGLPLTMEGEDQPMTQAARRFGNQLKGRYNLPVEMMDERLSSREADSLQRESPSGRKQARLPIDHIAAQLILQSWLNLQSEQNKNDGH